MSWPRKRNSPASIHTRHGFADGGLAVDAQLNVLEPRQVAHQLRVLGAVGLDVRRENEDHGRAEPSPCRARGAAVESWDPEGRAHIGRVGELVLTQPMPSMPLYFWGDEDGSRYRDSYFSVYPGVWRHGDWI